ncbi:DUF6228 family protein [Pseudarthrobacter sp. SSS035]|uniref:DUF6228 family protein n=1 Tax=Pseudarthrobacter sp. SSS035 TaxID=2931399 RepID=UPI00200D04DF|nr:DUF6228 family protein [Pseudarthrobacter sp. SSS035]
MVEIGRRERLTFGDVQRGPDGELLSMSVSVELENLRARREVTAHYELGFADLCGFFTDLAGHWQGWSGTRAYKSLEGDLLLEAAHTGSHIELSFTLQDPSFHDSWSVRGKLTIDSGEELMRVTENLLNLFAASWREDAAE